MTSSTDGPDQGDPAAWGFLGIESGKVFTALPIDAPMPSWEHGGRVPLYLRAPGAVAAAPPGDEDIDAATAEVSDAVTHENPESMRSVELRIADGWRFVPPARPAGHEDEAAVERRAAQGGRDPRRSRCCS